MSNVYNIKGSLVINDTQPIFGIIDDYTKFNYDDDKIATSKAVSDYIESKKFKGQDNRIIFNSGGTFYDSDDLKIMNNDLIVNGVIKTPYGMYTEEGAFCIKMINKTGSPSIKGKLVTYNTLYPNSFKYFPHGDDKEQEPYIGVIIDEGVEDGEFVYIALFGICYFYISNYSSDININDNISTYGSLNDGDLLKDIYGNQKIGYSLQNSNSGSLVKCFLFHNDKQSNGGGY